MKSIDLIKQTITNDINNGASVTMRIFYGFTFLSYKGVENSFECPEWMNGNTFKKYKRAGIRLGSD